MSAFDADDADDLDPQRPISTTRQPDGRKRHVMPVTYGKHEGIVIIRENPRIKDPNKNMTLATERAPKGQKP